MRRTHDTVDVCGIQVAALSTDTCLSLLTSRGGGGRSVHFANAKSIVDANMDVTYRHTLRAAWLVLPDGKPVARLVAKGSGAPQARIAGPDVFEQLLSDAKLRHFLIAPNEEVAIQLQSRWRRSIVGTVVPAVLENSALFPLDQFVEAIVRAEPTHVWIGIGSPKQDHLAFALAKKVDATVLAVGAAMEFSSGSIPRAPLIMQRYGFEWLHRLVSNPRRLWRRYLIGNIKFVLIVRRSR